MESLPTDPVDRSPEPAGKPAADEPNPQPAAEAPSSGPGGAPSRDAPRWHREIRGRVVCLSPRMCGRLRELPEWSGMDEDGAAEAFLGAHLETWGDPLAEVPEGDEVRVVVDAFSRQMVLAHGRTVIHVESF